MKVTRYKFIAVRFKFKFTRKTLPPTVARYEAIPHRFRNSSVSSNLPSALARARIARCYRCGKRIERRQPKAKKMALINALNVNDGLMKE
jgi:hypothetical protein